MEERAEEIIRKYYKETSIAFEYLYKHSLSVTKLALKIAEKNPHYDVNMINLKRSGMLHDIGIFMTHAPEIGCEGEYPYLAHGYLGRELLEKEGLEEIAAVCERHVGVGITVKDIERDQLPLPKRNMTPQNIEEKIICYADKFYSKKPKYLNKPKPLDKIRRKIAKYGTDKEKIFEGFVKMFGWDYI